MKRTLVLAALSWVVSVRLAPAEDLLSVFEDALQNDPLIREADANRRAAREARPQAWSALLPQLEGAARATRTSSEGTQPSFFEADDNLITIVPIATTSDSDSTGYTLQLRQSVFNWANWVGVRRSGREVAQAEVQYQASEQDLLLRVSQRYFNVLQARNTLEAQEAALEAIARQLEQTNKRFEVGLIAITDVQEAQAARDASAADVIAAKRALSTAEEQLREVTARQYATLARPGDNMPLATPAPAEIDQWVQLSLDQNLALIASRLEADIARDDVSIARAARLPSLDLVASREDLDSDVDQTTTRGGFFSSEFETNRTDDVVGLQVTVPLFTGGFNQSRVRQSQFLSIAARERVTRVSRETERLARDAYLGVNSEIARVQALRQALESSTTALRATEAGYEVGTRTAVDVLDARRQVVAAQTNYSGARYNYILNIIQLRLAAGNLDRTTLEEINSWLTVTQPVTAPPPPAQPTPVPQPQPTPPPQSAPTEPAPVTPPQPQR